MSEQDQNVAPLHRWMRPAVMTLSAIGISLACLFLLAICIIIPLNRFVPDMGEIGTPDVVFVLELGFLVLASSGLTGLFLRWIRRQTGTGRQYGQVLGVLIALIALEIGIFTFFGSIVHGVCKDRTTNRSTVRGEAPLP